MDNFKLDSSTKREEMIKFLKSVFQQDNFDYEKAYEDYENNI